MCRFVAYVGRPVLLGSLLVEPPASLIAQSLAAREAKTIVNADGFGIGWYGERDDPDLYHGVLPAWSDTDLASLCRQLRSRMFLAHIRSATTGEVSAANCHPFAAGRHLFMHNGQIGDYERVRRRVDALIPDALYSKRRGSGDSEAMFLAALGAGLEADPQGTVTTMLREVRRIMLDAGISKPLRFAAIHSDGAVLRYNAEGLAGLHDRPPPGRPPRLDGERREALRKLVLDGPDVAKTGLSAWTLGELCREVEERWGVRHREGHMGKVVRALGLSRQKARPSHPKADPAAREAFAKGGRNGASRQAPDALVPDAMRADAALLEGSEWQASAINQGACNHAV